MIESFKFSFLITKCETGVQVETDKLAFMHFVIPFHLSDIKTQF